MKSRQVNSEEDNNNQTRLLVKYALDRIESVLESIRQLKASEFPYNDSKDALCRIEELFKNTLQRLDATDAHPDYIKQLCSISLRHLFIYLPKLGFILRSTNVRNAFETFWPLRDIARKALDPEVKLILSSEWTYSPMIYHEIRALPGFVLIGLPASESSNPLLIPLCGHELGHAVWANKKGKLENIIKNTFYEEAPEHIANNWNEYSELFPSIDKPDEKLGANIFAFTRLLRALELLLKQAEECFCDFIGLKIYGTAFLHAFAYLFAPFVSSPRAITYPKLVKRVNYLIKAATKYKIEVPESYENMFENRPEPQLSSMDKLLLSISDYILDKTADKLISKAKSLISKTNIARPSDEESKRIRKRLELVVPASRCKSLADILNASWQAYHDIDLWKSIPDVLERKDRILKDLVLKNIEIFEFEQILNGGK